ncbi:decarboxylase, partial [Rhizobium sp. RAF56]
MSQDPKHKISRIDQFFSGPNARADRWQDLADAAEAWLAGSLDRARFEEALAELAVTESYFAYPGGQMLTALRDHAAADNAAATTHLVHRIVRAVMTRSFRHDANDWDAGEDIRDSVPELVPSSVTAREHHRPYFETLIVTGVPASNWPALSTEWRKLRRALDTFI